MLKRILTAIVLIPLVLLAIFKTTDRGFSAASAAFFLLALLEWAKLIKMDKYVAKIPYLFLGIALMAGCYFISPIIVYVIAIIFWLGAIAMVVRFPKDNQCWLKHSWLPPLVGLFVIIPCWVALNGIRQLEQGIASLIMLLVMIWAADTGAYFVGKFFGHTKLAAQVSPKKTVEGFLGGILLSVIIVTVVGFWKENFIFDIPFYLMLVCLTVIISVFGDLFESVVKRIYGVKDSGNILPGHGGLLDRIDSLTAAAPAFALGLWLLGYR